MQKFGEIRLRHLQFVNEDISLTVVVLKFPSCSIRGKIDNLGCLGGTQAFDSLRILAVLVLTVGVIVEATKEEPLPELVSGFLRLIKHEILLVFNRGNFPTCRQLIFEDKLTEINIFQAVGHQGFLIIGKVYAHGVDCHTEIDSVVLTIQ